MTLIEDEDKAVVGCFFFILAVVLALIIAVVVTGLYLAIKNWG